MFSYPHGIDTPPRFVIPDRLVDKGGAFPPLNFANLSLYGEDLTQPEHTVSTLRVPAKMERTSRSTSGIIPYKVSIPDTRETTRPGEIVLLPSRHPPRNSGLIPLPLPHHGSTPPPPVESITGDQDREYEDSTTPARSGTRCTSNGQSSTS